MGFYVIELQEAEKTINAYKPTKMVWHCVSIFSLVDRGFYTPFKEIFGQVFIKFNITNAIRNYNTFPKLFIKENTVILVVVVTKLTAVFTAVL